jgi:hypothetical protein
MRRRLPVVAVLVAVAVNPWPFGLRPLLSRNSANLLFRRLLWTLADIRERDHDGLAVWCPSTAHSGTVHEEADGTGDPLVSGGQ